MCTCVDGGVSYEVWNKKEDANEKNNCHFEYLSRRNLIVYTETIYDNKLFAIKYLIFATKFLLLIYFILPCFCDDSKTEYSRNANSSYHQLNDYCWIYYCCWICVYCTINVGRSRCRCCSWVCDCWMLHHQKLVEYRQVHYFLIYSIENEIFKIYGILIFPSNDSLCSTATNRFPLLKTIEFRLNR